MMNWMDEMMIFIQWNQLFPHQSLFFYIVKNVKIDDINTSNALNIYVIIVTNECQCTGCLIVQNIEASDFNHSGGYCYELFFSSKHVFTVHLEAYTFPLHIYVVISLQLD